MNKKTFLTSIAVLAATLAADASAALPDDITDKIQQVTLVKQSFETTAPFVLERPNENGFFVAAHRSHSSHSSHSSHTSSRY